MVLSVRNQNVSLAVHGDAFKTLRFHVKQTENFSEKKLHEDQAWWYLEFPVALTPAAKGSKEGAVWVENLDSVVAGVRHKDEPSFVYCHTPVFAKTLKR